jgi:ABC-type sulfate/molybdate transport systems ATPase subunit
MLNTPIQLHGGQAIHVTIACMVVYPHFVMRQDAKHPIQLHGGQAVHATMACMVRL